MNELPGPKVYYNIPREDEWIDDDYFDPDFDTVSSREMFYYSGPIPRQTHDEFDEELGEVSALSDGIFNAYASERCMPRYASTGDLMWTREEDFSSDDRTIYYLTGLPMYSVALFRRLQEEVLEKWPLWRIRLLSYHERGELIIYPNGIWFQGQVHTDDAVVKLARDENRLCRFEAKGYLGTQLLYASIKTREYINNRSSKDGYKLLGVYEEILNKSGYVAFICVEKDSECGRYIQGHLQKLRSYHYCPQHGLVSGSNDGDWHVYAVVLPNIPPCVLRVGNTKEIHIGWKDVVYL